ncbi:hypothetical protein DD599_25635, partial [Enterobacter cloacae complex sp. CH23B]
FNNSTKLSLDPFASWPIGMRQAIGLLNAYWTLGRLSNILLEILILIGSFIYFKLMKLDLL